MDSKTRLRTQALARRDGLDGSCRKEKSAIICSLLEQQAALAWLKAGETEEPGERTPTENRADPQAYQRFLIQETKRLATLAKAPGQRRPMRVATYAPLRSEVDVMPFVEAAYQRAWDVCFPCMIKGEEAAAAMAFVLVPQQRFDKARATFLKTPTRSCAVRELEEEGFERVLPESLDFVIVPLVAFDAAGNRLGYGGGNYDRMLPRLRPDASVVGAAFSEQRVAEVPIEEHDRPLPLVISA